MKISIDMAASQEYGHRKIDLVEDLCISEEDWENMTKKQKEEAINDYLADLPEQPFWMVDSFEEE